ncbi:synaptotagmin-like protein 2 isoform X6 [Mastomys coucha]|uniref:synaptotagmin-like protein 2 isoform X6 n=1 Tax=Mastomys coucha TaxID=35658 RepID=UPI001261500D|nr:synaptotagmin-like protein 2 isoform X6 [Mastomys coucha]
MNPKLHLLQLFLLCTLCSKMIDLSFLTEEEQDTILKVLQRDAALKRAEEERVRHLPEKIKDDQQLKNMSGQWFYEAKAKRHRDKIHGADIIRASMRRKRLPAVADQNKDTAMRAKESWVNNVNKDAVLPPELAVVEEPEDDTGPAGPSSSVVDPVSSAIDISQENTRTPAVSLPKQRKNPFDSPRQLPEDHSSQQTKTEQSKTGKAGLFQISKEGDLSESKEKPSIPDLPCQKLEKPKQPVSMEPEYTCHTKAPIPKARKLIYKSNDLKKDDNQSFPGQRRDSLNARGAPRGILKRNSSSSSTDSETLRLNYNFDPKSKIISPGLTIHERISEKEHSLEDDSSTNSLEPLKHVRFSAVKDELPQSPRPVLSQEVGEFTVLESDKLQNGTEDAGDIDEFQDHPELSHKKPLSLCQSVSSPSVSERETEKPMSSGSAPSDEIPCHSDILPTRPHCVENSPIINEQQDKSSHFTKLQSELSKSPSDELTQCLEPEPSQTSDYHFRDHRQGKPPLMALTGQTSSHLSPCAPEIRKTTDDSISKVLDWFNRSSHTEDRVSSLQHLQGTDLRQQTDSKAQISNALMTDNTCLKEDDSKVPMSTKIKLKPVKSDLAFQEEEDMPVSETCKDSDALLKSNSENLSQQDTLKEGPDTLQRSESYRVPSRRNENMGGSQGSESTGEGVGNLPADSDYLLKALKRSDSEAQAPWNTKHPGSLGKEETKFHVPQKSKGNTHINADSSVIVLGSILKDDAERKSKTRNTSLLKPSLKTENSALPFGAADSGSSWKKPEDQEEASEDPKNQVLREKYKRVSDRIAFWEGGRAGAKFKAPQLTSACSQEPSATAHQPMKSQVMSLGSLSSGQSDCSQVTAKQVVFDGDDQTPHLTHFNSSNKPEPNRPSISVLSKNHPLGNQSEKVTLLQTMRDEIHSSLETERCVIDKSNGNFKVLSLRERMDEPNIEQVYNHSQFENLRKFWDLGDNVNSKHNNENNTATNKETSVSLNGQKSKEFNTMKLSREKTHEVEEGRHFRPGNVIATEETEKLNFKCMLQVPPDETIFPQNIPPKIIYQLGGNESAKENEGKNTECFVTSVIKKACSDQEIQESIAKTSILPNISKDTFNDRLQKLLAEATSPASQTSGKKVHGQQALKAGVSENGTGPQKKSFAKDEEEVAGFKKSPKEPQRRNQQDCSTDKLLKEATRTPLTPLPSLQEPVTSRPISPPKDDLLFEKWIKENHRPSAYQREITAPLAGTALTQKDKHCDIEGMLQLAAEGSPPLAQPSHSFEGVSSSPADVPLSWDARLRSQDGALPSQREISEAIEKVVLPSKPAVTDVNAMLQKLLREAGEVDTKLPEREQTADIPSSPQRVSPLWAVPGPVVPNKDFHSFCTVSDTTHEGWSHLSARMSPSTHATMSPTSTVTQSGQELLQEVAETVREMVIQPKSEHPEFKAGLEKLLKETLQTSLPKDEKDTVTISPSALTGSEEEHSPVLKTLERRTARKLPSKSLEDIPSDSSNQAKVDNLPEELVRSAEDDQKADQEPDTNEHIPGISTVPSLPDNQFSHPDKLKRMSKSVPAFLQDEASGSVMSIYSGDFGNLEVKGSVQFAIDYVESLKELHVFVAQCKDLAAADVKKQRSDPYVKTYLLPDKGKMGKKKTLVVKKTLNPVYNEILRYKIERQSLKTQKLNLSVWHRDTFKRNSFLGEVELDLETWDWDSKQNKQLKWYPLKRKTAPVALETENRGEMKLALQYVPEPSPGKKLPTTGEVHIWVKECLDLPLLRGSHLNSFVKCTILPDTSRKSRQKTRAVGKTTNPVFNHTMVYDGFRPEDLMEACVELTVWDHYKLTNQFLGGLRIGFGTGKSYGTEVDWMDSTSEEVALWEKMVNSPNTWVEAMLPLRMLLIAKLSK